MNIKGEKILLRAMELEDMEAFCEMMNDSYIESMIGGWSFPISMYEQVKWFEKVYNDKNNLRFAIVLQTNNDVIGMANLTNIDWKNRTAFHGMKLSSKTPKGEGIGTDTVMALMKYVFEELQLNRLDGAIIEYNKASMALYKKCGWKIEGNRRKSIYKKNKYHDNILVGILREEYFDLINTLGDKKIFMD